MVNCIKIMIFVWASIASIFTHYTFFPFADHSDRVQCVFCRGSLHNWDPTDTPMAEHAKAFAFCRFVKGLECGNKEYKNDLLTADDLKNLSFLGKPGKH